jgi:hypothetical protein
MKWFEEKILKNKYVYLTYQVGVGKVLFHTARAFLGLGPKLCMIGDPIWALHGGTLFYAWGAHVDGIHQEYLGECYLHGFMQGETLQSPDIIFKRVWMK